MNFRVCRFCHCCLFDWTYWPTLYDWSEQYAVWGRESDVFTVIILTTLCDRHQGAHWSWDGHCACVLYPRSHHLQHTHTASQSDALILPYIAQYGAAPCSESVHLSSVTDKKSWQEILQLARGLSYWFFESCLKDVVQFVVTKNWHRLLEYKWCDGTKL